MWLQAIYLFSLIYCFALSSQWLALRAPLLAVSLWLLASGAGLLVPVWALLPAALTLWFAERPATAPSTQQSAIRALLPSLLAQALTYAAFVAIGLDNPPMLVVIASCLLHLTLYVALTLGFRYLTPTVRRSTAYACSLVTMVALALPLAFSSKVQSLSSRVELGSLPFLALRAVATPTLTPVPLTGGMAWVSATGTATRDDCALVLHGADRNGSRQAAAQSLIAALHEMNILVLAVDHPGYGQSPAPESSIVEAWDPALLTTQAIAFLRHNYQCRSLDVYGHSMGASEALRLAMSNDADRLRAIRLLGAGTLEDGPKFEQYWYGRFHEDRRLAPGSVPFPFWQTLVRAYYDNVRIARALSAKDQQSIDFIAYGNENSNLVATRDNLWAELGNPQRLSLPMTHYFNAVSVGPVLVLDSSAIEQTRISLSGSRPSPGRTPSAGLNRPPAPRLTVTDARLAHRLTTHADSQAIL